jgi:acyl-CoA synthetase (AMP-forming)/AMP-acid ligase II
VTAPAGALAWCIRQQASQRADSPAVLLPGGRLISYGMLEAKAASCAQILRQKGVRTSDRVALVVGDHPGFPAWYAGIQLLGAVPCPIPAYLTTHEAARALEAVAPKWVLADEVAPLPENGQVRSMVFPHWQGDSGWPLATTTPCYLSHRDGLSSVRDDVAGVHVTYGGVGRPLGVVHRCQMQASAARSFCLGTALSPDDMVLGILPFAHIFSFTANLLAPFYAGATLLMGHGLPLPAVLDLVEEHRPSLSFLTPGQAERLIDAQRRRPRDLSSLNRVWAGGAPFGADLVARFKEITGVSLYQGYGLTEAFVVCANPASDEAARPETLGLPFPGFRMRVVDPDGSELADGVEGELQVAGEAVFDSYLGEPGETDRVLRGGWLSTGDFGVRDPDGHYRFRGWKKRIIKTLGLPVDLAEVEAELACLPGVVAVELECRVRPTWGHVLSARLSVTGPPPSPFTVRRQLERRLSLHKIPRPIEIVSV